MTKTVLLGEVAQINPESIGKSYSFNEILYLDTSSVTDNKFLELQHFKLKDAPSRAKRIVQDKDIVYSTVRPNLKHFGYISNPSYNTVASTGFAVIRANENVDSLYLYYWLSANERTKYLASIADSQTSTFPAFNPSILENLKISLPELDIQRKIAEILGTLDEKIELNRQMNETLEQMGQALFRHYFIDNPQAEKWGRKPLDEVAEFLNGLAMQKYPKVNGKPTLPVIKIREMTSGITPNTDIASSDIPDKYVIDNGDLLFSWSGTLIVKFWTEGRGALNQHLFKVSSDKYPEWLYYYWLRHHLDGFIETAKSKATTMGHIQRRHLHESIILVPEAITLEKLTAIFEPILKQQVENMLEIQSLTNLRDTLLPRLISGKVNL
jgi:type I restriction enzyme S subunit